MSNGCWDTDVPLPAWGLCGGRASRRPSSLLSTHPVLWSDAEAQVTEPRGTEGPRRGLGKAGGAHPPRLVHPLRLRDEPEPREFNACGQRLRHSTLATCEQPAYSLRFQGGRNFMAFFSRNVTFNLIFHLICAFMSKCLLCFPSQSTRRLCLGDKEKQEEAMCKSLQVPHGRSTNY